MEEGEAPMQCAALGRFLPVIYSRSARPQSRTLCHADRSSPVEMKVARTDPLCAEKSVRSLDRNLWLIDRAERL